MDLPLSDGELTPCLLDQVVCGPLGEQEPQIPYPGGSRAYPFHPPLFCRLEIALPGVAALLAVDVDDEAGVDTEPGLTPLLFVGVEGTPPQPTKVSAIKKMNTQIFTENSPALIRT